MTPRQTQLLKYIDEYMREGGGIAPTIEDMAHGVGLASKSGVIRLLNALEERGFIRRMRNRARAIEIIKLPNLNPPTESDT